MTRRTPLLGDSTADASTSADQCILDISDLVIEYGTRRGVVRSLDSASMQVAPSSIVAVVGESGSGKTTLGMATGRLLASNARYVSGRLLVAGVDVLACDRSQLQALRRTALGYVFQNPIAALDPTMRIRKQLELNSHNLESSSSIEESLTDVGLADIPRLLRQYPHEISGGMAQRVAIAMAVRRSPALLVADEPTASVDATARKQIMELLIRKCRETGCALMLLTHDLHAVGSFATHIAVMYGGRVVETGPAPAVLTTPKHPYTRALLSALPGKEHFGDRLSGIPGVPPTLTGESAGCAFVERCAEKLPECATHRPILGPAIGEPDRTVCCHLHTRDGAGHE